MTRRRWRNGNTAAASPSMARCALRPLTAPGASGCSATAPAHRSPPARSPLPNQRIVVPPATPAHPGLRVRPAPQLVARTAAAHPYATPGGSCPRRPACPRAATLVFAPARKCPEKRAEQPVATENPRFPCYRLLHAQPRALEMTIRWRKGCTRQAWWWSRATCSTPRPASTATRCGSGIRPSRQIASTRVSACWQGHWPGSNSPRPGASPVSSRP